MPRKLIVALLVSLLLHCWLMAGLPGWPASEDFSSRPALTATLRPLPKPAAAAGGRQGVPQAKAASTAAAPPPRVKTSAPAPSVVPADDIPPPAEPVESSVTPLAESAEPVPPALVQPSSGVLRYDIVHESSEALIGRAEVVWQFAADGSYRLQSLSETVGLVALFKSVRLETRSTGRLIASGLQPEIYRTWRNGEETRERADFVWPTRQVVIGREGTTLQIVDGTQDLLSLTFQLAYLKAPENGSRIGVVTGKKYEVYELDALGEETLLTPAGEFRTLHLRAAGETITELWIALDLYRLPVKIRFTDKKGGRYFQVAREIGQPVADP